MAVLDENLSLKCMTTAHQNRPFPACLPIKAECIQRVTWQRGDIAKEAECGKRVTWKRGSMFTSSVFMFALDVCRSHSPVNDSFLTYA